MWIDFLVAAILIIFIFRGDKRGFLASLIGLVGWAVSLIAAFLCYPLAVDFLDTHTGIRDNISSHVTLYVKEQLMAKLSGTSASQLPDSVLAAIRSTANSAIDTQAASVAKPIVNVIMNVIAIVLVLLIVRIIFKIIQVISMHVTGRGHGPVGVLNSVGGMLFGLVEGAILAYLLLLVLDYVALFSGITALSNQLDNSIVMGLIEHMNMIPYADEINELIS